MSITILLAGALIVIGSVFALAAAIGLVRLPDVYSRMHAATKAGTLGSGLMMIALALAAPDPATASRALAGLAFFMLTAPVASHLLARAAYDAGYSPGPETVIDEMKEKK